MQIKSQFTGNGDVFFGNDYNQTLVFLSFFIFLLNMFFKYHSNYVFVMFSEIHFMTYCCQLYNFLFKILKVVVTPAKRVKYQCYSRIRRLWLERICDKLLASLSNKERWVCVIHFDKRCLNLNRKL